MKNLNHWLNEHIYCLHVLFSLIIIALVLVYLPQVNSITVLSDEFGYWANAASLTGYNWKDLITLTPYYSIGYSIWLIPLIKFFQNLQLAYKAAIVLNGIFLVFSYLAAYSFGRLLFEKKTRVLASFFAFMVTIFPNNIIYATVAWSETLLWLIIWLISIQFVHLSKSFNGFRALLCILLLAYLYIVHPRGSIVFFFGSVLTALLALKSFNMKSYIRAGYCVLFAILLSIGISALKDIQINSFWDNSLLSEMNNIGLDASTVGSYFGKLTHDFPGIILSFFGKLEVVILETSFLVFLPYFTFFRELHQGKTSTNWGIWAWVLILPIMMTAATALQMNDWESRKEIFIYSRYLDFALGPLLLCGYYQVIKPNRKNWIPVLLAGFIFFTMIRYTYQRVLFANGYFNSICSPFIGTFVDNVDNLKTAFFFLILYSAVIAGWLLCIAYYAQNGKTKSFLKNGFLLFTVITYMVLGQAGQKYVLDARERYYPDSVRLAEFLDLYDNDIKYISGTMFDPTSANPKYLQFLLGDRPIEVVVNKSEYIDPETENNPIFLVNSKAEQTKAYLKKHGFKEIMNTSLLAVYEKR